MRACFLLIFLWFPLVGLSQNKFEVFFDFNQDVPNESSQIKINQWIQENKNAEVIKIFGFCDSVDDRKYNKELAMRRVNTMLGLLTQNGIKIAEMVELKSFGKDFKYSKIQDENRKVEIFYNLPKAKTSTLTAIKGKTPFSVPEPEATPAAVAKDYEFKPLAELVEEERSGLAARFDKAKVGDLIRINNISFYFNSEKVMEESFPILEELYQIMVTHPNMRIEIHGHICCNPNPLDTKLSYRRALVILKFLTGRGIAVNRLAYKGFGSNDPIYRVPEKNEMQRAANRRVEILIVSNKPKQ